MGGKDEKTSEKVWWLWFGFGATFVYTILVIVFISQYKVGSGGRIGELGLNGIGDFLAGVFAPLAFLWLFVATMMQSAELRLQREELALNREEMREARAVMKDQAKAAKDQAETASLQMQAAREQINLQREIAEATYAVSLLDTRATIWNEVREGMNQIRRMTPNDLDSFAGTFSRAQLVFGPDIANAIEPIFNAVVELMFDLHKFELEHGTDAFKYYLERLATENWHGVPIPEYELEDFKVHLVGLIEKCDAVVKQIADVKLLQQMRAVMTIKVSLSNDKDKNHVLDIG